LFLSFGPLRAQNLFTVTSTAGDQSTNSLGWAVTSLNAAGDGAIIMNNGSGNVTLNQALASLSSANVTLQGQDLNLFGQNGAQSQLLFQNSFVQKDNFFFENLGTSGPGLNMAVTANSWTATQFTNFWAGSGPATTLIGGSGVAATSGGNNGVTIGTFTVGNGFVEKGGAGGSVTDTNGTGDTGGNGGSADLTGTSVTMNGNIFQVLGGDGGSVTDLGSGTGQHGGDAGTASVSFGSIASGPFGNFDVQGGQGGAGMNGGKGGAATALAGSLTLTQGFNVQGGQGGNGSVVSGNGGSAFTSIGTYSGTGGSNFKTAGGNGGVGSTSAGDGGNGTLVGGTVTINGPGSGFQVLGGNGGNFGPVVSGPAGDGGNGGAASVSLTTLNIISASTFKVLGGAGGSGSSNAAVGQGGNGGNTTFNLGSFIIGTNTNLSLSSGFGGTGGTANSGGTGGQGGDGGTLAVTFGNLSLGTGSNLNLSGGVGGGGGAVASGGTGGDGGSGGNVTLSVGSVTLASGNVLNITGGAGGSGGLGGTIGSSGANGQASATFGSLFGSGSVNMGGNAVLQVAQGLFIGTLTGSENLQKTSAATLTLSGSNGYGGGTSILAGTLAVDTGGTLGSGIVQVGSGSLLTYLNSADASNTTIANNAGATVAFVNSSTAGNASVTTGGNVFFLGNSLGATSSMDILSGGLLDISSHSGALTIGSLLGNGLVTLGSNALFDGANNQATTFSGDITGSGALVKVGTGTLTMALNSGLTGGLTILGGTVAAGSMYGLGHSSVVNGGTLVASGVPSTFQVWNNYIQTSAGTLQMGLGGAGASSADKMNVGGTTSLDGTLVLFDYGGLTAPPIGSTMILIAGSGALSGVFQNVTENFTGSRFLPVYLSNSVELLSINASFQASASTPNQIAIGTDLDHVVFNPQLNGLMSFLGTLSDPALRTAMTQLSPEDFVSLYSLGFQGSAARFDAVEQRLNQLKEDVDETLWMPGFSQGGMTLFAANMSPSRERRMAKQASEDWSGFLSVNGGVFQVDPDTNAAGFKSTSFGLTAAGLDVRLSRQAAAGLLLSYQHGDVTLGSGGTLADDEAQAGLYGMVYADGFYAEGLAEGGLHTYKTQRTGYNGIATASPQGTQFDGDLEMGYAFDSNHVHLGPYGALQYAVVQVNAFNETGSQAPLSYPSQSADSLLAQAGLQANGNLKLGGGSVLTPGIKVAFEHEFDYSGGTFQAGLGTGDVFTVAGPKIGQDGFLASVGGDLAIGKELHFFLDYQGQFGRADMSSHQVDLGSRIGF
jgi:uncharacterized protein with beta-barrel porin domain